MMWPAAASIPVGRRSNSISFWDSPTSPPPRLDSYPSSYNEERIQHYLDSLNHCDDPNNPIRERTGSSRLVALSSSLPQTHISKIFGKNRSQTMNPKMQQMADDKGMHLARQRGMSRTRSRTISSVRTTSINQEQLEEIMRTEKSRNFMNHVDFVDGRPGKTFGEVVLQANEWLDENPDIDLLTCETVSWKIDENDTFYHGAGLSNQSTSHSNKVIIGLRLWYFSRGDQFWKHQTTQKKKIGFSDFAPGKGETIISALMALNSFIKHNPIKGNIMKVETLNILADYPSETCRWTEQPDVDRRYASFLRVLYVEFEGAEPLQAEIVLRDFCPNEDKSSPHCTFERYSDLHMKAAKWIHRHDDYNLLNIQTLTVKIKGEMDSRFRPADFFTHIKLWENAYFTEHGQKVTKYLDIIRLAYLRPTGGATLPLSTSLPYKLSSKTFVPQLVGPGSSEEISDSSQRYEDVRTTVERVTAWIKESGARVQGIETLPVRNKEVLGPETTFHQRSKQEPHHSWVHCFRLTLNGEYRDLETDFHSKSRTDSNSTG